MASEKDGSNVVVDEISPTSSPKPHIVTDLQDGSPRSSPRPPPTKQEIDAKRVEQQEAMQYWGYLVKSDKCGSDKLDCLLTGIANYISTHFRGTKDCPDLTPTQLAAFYRAVGGNYDVLFVETQSSSISFIYKALGCLHSLQPENEANGHAIPCVPALKTRGFVTWQTIQLLLGPEEHVPFLQAAVAQFDIVDPSTGLTFPKILPDDAFPKEPDPAMTKWYDEVHDQLQKGIASPEVPQRSLSLSNATDSEASGDERFAATYFRNPMFKDSYGRPQVTAVRGAPYKSPRSRGSRQPSIADRGKGLLNNVRHFISPPSTSYSGHHQPPRHGRRGSNADRYRDDEDQDDYEDLTPTGLHPDYRQHKQPRPARPKSPELMTDSDSDSVHVHKRPQTAQRKPSSRERKAWEDRERDRRERDLQREIKELSRERNRDQDRHRERVSPGSKHDSKSPPLRHRRSYEDQVSPTDYFKRPFFEDDGPRRNSHSHPYSSYGGPDVSRGGFAPSKEPSMASRVANMQHSSRTSSPRHRDVDSGGSYPPRSVPEEQGSYNGRPTVRYSRRSIDEDRKRDRDRENRPRYERGGQGSDEYLPQPRPGLSSSRSRSYERDRDRDREADDRLRQSTRYVKGAGGRSYPSQVPWQ